MLVQQCNSWTPLGFVDDPSSDAPAMLRNLKVGFVRRTKDKISPIKALVLALFYTISYPFIFYFEPIPYQYGYTGAEPYGRVLQMTYPLMPRPC